MDPAAKSSNARELPENQPSTFSSQLQEEKSLISGKHTEPAMCTGRVRKTRQYSSNYALAIPAFRRRAGSNVPRADSSNAHSFRTSKRGRPRKYMLPMSTAANPVVTLPVVMPHKSMGPDNGGNVGGGDPNGNLTQNIAIRPLGPSMNNFAYCLQVKTGEDICLEIFSFCKQRPMCVLSANGTISQAVVSRAEGESVNYEGSFDIIRLSGIISEKGELFVYLAGQDHNVFGGRVAGTLIAASPVQIILGSLPKSNH